MAVLQKYTKEKGESEEKERGYKAAIPFSISLSSLIV